MITIEGRPGAEIRVIGGISHPRLVAVVGDRDLDFDLILGGHCGLSTDEAMRSVAAALINLTVEGSRTLDDFALGAAVHQSWTDVMRSRGIESGRRECRQLLPVDRIATVDVPKMDTPFEASTREWSILAPGAEWPFSFPLDTSVVTDMRALLGHPITEVSRWSDGDLQMLAIGPDDVQPDRDQIRVVPLSTLVAHDATLSHMADTPLGCSWWRADGASVWQKWHGWAQ